MKSVASAIRELLVKKAKHFDPFIKVDIKTHYGTDHMYVSSEHAEAINMLTGRKTVTKKDIEALKMLGFIVYHQSKKMMM